MCIVATEGNYNPFKGILEKNDDNTQVKRVNDVIEWFAASGLSRPVGFVMYRR